MLFSGSQTILSNMSWAPIDYKGTRFYTTEHLYQYKKAQHYGDKAAANQIRNLKDPFAAKKRGRRVSADASQTSVGRALQETWWARRAKLMEEILALKAYFHPDFREALMQSGERHLVESTPDAYWGRGRLNPATATRFPDVYPLQGQNMTGLCLMRVRAQLRDPTGMKYPTWFVFPRRSGRHR